MDTQPDNIITQLKEADTQVHAIFQSAPDAIIVIDEKGTIVDWNPMAEKMFGWKRDQAIGKLLSKTIIPEKYRAAHQEGLTRFLETGKGNVINKTIEIQALDYQQREFDVSLSIAYSYFQGHTLFIGFIRDITEQKKAEENIRYNALLLQSVSDAVISTDEKFIIKSWNEAAEKMYGYKSEEVIGKDIEILNVKLSDENLRRQRQSVKPEGYHQDEYIVKDKNGNELTILASVNIIHAGEKVSGYVAVHRDITVRKKLEGQLRIFNKELYRLVEEKTGEIKSIFERVSDAFLALDKDWRYTYANKQLGEMVRVDAQSLIGRNIWEVFPDAVGSVTYETFSRAMKEQQYICSTDYYAPLDLWHENHIYPSPNGLSVFIRDVTERKKAEEKIFKANRIYSFISHVNQIIVHTKDEATLFREACRIAVEIGRFKMAWIGLVDEQTNTLVPVMQNSDPKTSPVRIEPMSLANGNNNHVLAAIRHGRHQVNNEINTTADPIITNGDNYQSAMTVPLSKFGKVVGTFSFYTDIKNFFDGEEINLLEEAAVDISFAMDVFEKEKLKKITEHALKHSEEKYRSLIQQAADGIVLFDSGNRILDANESALRLLGYTYEDLTTLSLNDVLSSEELKTNPVNFDLLEKGESTIKLRKMIRKNGSVVETEVHAKKLPDGKFLALIRDLTERKKAEQDLKHSYEAIRDLVSHLQDIREEERLKMAQEIHDELGQQLTVMKMDVSWLDKKLAAMDPQIKEKTETLKKTLDATVKTVRRISSELRPSVLDDMGLGVAIEWHAKEIEKRADIRIELDITEEELQLSDTMKINLFRVVQESLTNVVRYAQASKVHISLQKDDSGIILTIRDNGIGFEPDRIAVKKTLGILGMKERIAGLSGKLSLESSPGNGTLIKVTIPPHA